MNKIKKMLIASMVISAMASSAYAKCANNTYGIICSGYTKVTAGQLINYLIRLRNAAPTATPKATAAPAATPKATAAPTAAPKVTPTPKAPTAAPKATATPKATAAPTATPKTTAAPAATSASAIEKEVFELVNEVRAQYGLSKLTWADDLANVARAHSRDMINRSFFDHTNPDGYSPFDRLRNNGISYRTAAENIAYGQRTPKAVMDAWMNSSGHRANILNANVKELGVGAATNSSGTIYWTQVFVAR